MRLSELELKCSKGKLTYKKNNVFYGVSGGGRLEKYLLPLIRYRYQPSDFNSYKSGDTTFNQQ